MRIPSTGAALLAALAASTPSPSVGNETIAALEGIWTSHNAFGPELSGELAITRIDGVWHARIADSSTHGTSLDLVFPDGGGAFSGRETRSGRAIEGFWFQPPGLPGVGYATPVHLKSVARNEWRGAVDTLPQTFTLHLAVARDEGERWIGAFRNPEFNMNGGASRFRASRTGDELAFTARGGELSRTARLSADAQSLQIEWPPLPAPITLRRDETSGAPSYLPRANTAYHYSAPSNTGDGWRVGRAKSAGFDEAALSGIVEGFIANDPASSRPQLIHALLVARHGKLVLEEYFHGTDRDTPHDIRSAGKSIASMLMGAAMRDGAALAPETPIYGLLDEYEPFANPDPRKSQITLAHLLTHTSGLDCDDNNEASAGNEGAMQGQSEETDWWRYTLDLAVAHEPGTRYAYCTAGVNLIGAALHTATGEAIPDLFDRPLAEPLEFGRYHWNLMPNQAGYLGGGAHLRPRDLLKLGQVMLDGGVWNGRRILDRRWVATSTAAHIEINEATTGMDAETFANTSTRGSDGYAWHRYGVKVGDHRVEAFEANGNGGQFLVVVPQYELVVVMTGGNYGQGGIWTRWRDDVIGAQIIPAIVN